jgi:hypothetical protein
VTDLKKRRKKNLWNEIKYRNEDGKKVRSKKGKGGGVR